MTSFAKRFAHIVWDDPWARVSCGVLVLWVFVSLLPFFWPHLAYIPAHLPHRLRPPSWEYPLGVDSNGSSLVLLLMNGASTSLLVSVATISLCVAIGVPLGALAGYRGGALDTCLSRVMDILLAFPPLVLPLAITAFFGGGALNVVLALSVTGWVSFARLVRGQFLSLRKAEFVEASRSLGASHLRLMAYHIFPNTLSPLAIQATFSLATVIISEAGLSFLGLGAQGSLVSWGALLSDGRSFLTEAPHMTMVPSLALFSVVASLNFIGEALRVALNPRG